MSFWTCFLKFLFIFFPAEEMACLGTWKEGSSRYLVSMLNHSHVYTDEARYRCFVFQRQHSNEPGSSVTYKMAQSLFASCLGLWNVNEGHKTFTMTKCKPLWTTIALESEEEAAKFSGGGRPPTEKSFLLNCIDGHANLIKTSKEH